MKEDQAAQTESKQDEFAGHQPMPWRIEDTRIVDGDGWLVCETASRTVRPHTHADIVTTRELIAAAPRLLRERDEARALLEEAIVYVEECEQFNKPMCRTLSKRIKALLQGGAQ